MCTKFETVLICGERISGFRGTFGGLRPMNRVEPNLAIFGKASGNGFALITISVRGWATQAAYSTFWTELLEPVAALGTLGAMEKHKSWGVNSVSGPRQRLTGTKICQNSAYQ
jgi:glutamate-1-semialdehyde 2,1-aminomutase